MLSAEYLAGLFDATGDVYVRASDGVVYSWLTLKVKDAQVRSLVAVEVGGRMIGKSVVKIGGTFSSVFATQIVEHLHSGDKLAMVRDYLALRSLMESKEAGDRGALDRFQRRQQLAERIMARKRPATWARAVDAAGAAS